MGFRTGAYAKVWEVRVKSPKVTSLRISVSKKNRDTGEYDTDFSGFVSCLGDVAAQAAKLETGDRIKIGDIDVSTRYVKETNTQYTDFKMYNFEAVNDSKAGQKKPGGGQRNSGGGRRNNYASPDELSELETDDNDMPF